MKILDVGKSKVKSGTKEWKVHVCGKNNETKCGKSLILF